MSLPKMTLEEKYYALNAALYAFLAAQGVRCPVNQFGIDPATLKPSVKDQTQSRYPYIQTFILNPQKQAHTSQEGGIYTRFDFQLSFFTSPESELDNTAQLFKPFNLAVAAFSDINLRVFLLLDPGTGAGVYIADVLNLREERSSRMVSGAAVPKAVLIVKLAAVCAYPDLTDYPDAGVSTDLDNAVEYKDQGVPF